MKNENGSKISKPFGLFVVITIGVILMAYVALGLIATEIKVDKDNAKMQKAKKISSLIRADKVKQKEVIMVKNVSGTVMSIQENVVTVQSSLGTEESYNVQLMLTDEDLTLVKVGDEMTAMLAKEVNVENIEDGSNEVSNVVVEAQLEEE